MKKKISTGFIILNNKNEILLGKTNWNPINSWTAFKGAVEDGETNLQAAKRELKEESGIDLYNKTIQDQIYFSYDIKSKTIHLYLYKDIYNEIYLDNLKCSSFWTGENNDEHPEILDFGWFALEDAQTKVLLSQKGMISYLIENIH